jgi:PilZ domain
MKPRYSERIQATFPVIITVGSLVSEGRILDLTVPGCLIESPVSVTKGDYLQLKLSLPGLNSPFSVALAAVRWTNGSQFGVEFIKMNEKEQRQLNQVMARHLSNRVLNQEAKRHQFSEPGGQNWHLDTYSLAGGSKGAA